MDAREFNVDDATVRSQPPGRTDEESPDGEPLDRESLEGEQTVITVGNPSSVPSQPPGIGTPAEVARVLLGHRLSHFFLETLVGGGGMGAVFRARDTRLDRTVAIKVIPRVGEDAELQRRFRNEAQSAARLDHPNIARVFDVGQHGGWHYIVFEYIDGTNLRDLVQNNGVLSVDDAVYYTRQVAEALDHAHRRGVVHRDIKPSNVLITTDGQAKLVDMGLARAQQLEVSDDMTASGVTLGTFDYISPEQARDPRDADVRSDIYSLGCTFYFALTGSAPYPSGTVLQKLLSHGSSPPPDPRRIRTGLSKSLVAVLHRMLAKEPADRYRKPLDLVADLYLLAARDSLPRSLSAGSIAVAPPSRFGKLVERHLPWILAASVLLISAAWLQIMSSVGGDLQLTTPPPQVVRDELVPPVTALDTPMVTPSGTVIGSPAGLSASALPAPATNDRANNETRPSTAPGNAPSVVPTADDSRSAVVKPTVVRIMGADSLLSGTIDAENRMLVGSMAEAVEAVNNESAFQVIEIGDTTIRSGPVSLPPRSLTIRGTTNNSELSFQPAAASGLRVDAAGTDETGTDEAGNGKAGTGLFAVGAQRLAIENLRLRWRSETSSERVSESTLFSLVAGSRVTLKRCVVTISNAGRNERNGSENRTPLNLFAYWATPQSDIQTSDLLELLEIELVDCIVRGELTMLNLSEPISVDLRWENGLLAVSGSMVRSVGVRIPIPFLMAADNSRIQMVLNDLTAATGAPMIEIDCRENQQPIMVDRLANRCVFVSETGEPVVHLNDSPAGYDPNRSLAFRGRDNQYDIQYPDQTRPIGVKEPILLKETLASGLVRQVVFGQWASGTAPKWAAESNARWSVEWAATTRPRGPYDRRSTQDYRQDGLGTGGFRPSQLPALDTFPVSGLGGLLESGIAIPDKPLNTSPGGREI